MLANKMGLDLERIGGEIPGSETITEAEVTAYLEARGRTDSAQIRDVVDDAYPQTRQQRLLLVGGGLGAVQLLDSLSRIEGQRATVIVDDDPALRGKTVMGVPILGGFADIEALAKQNLFDAAVVSISTSIPVRERMWNKLQQLGIPGANIVDPTARVQRNAVLGSGNVVLAFCHIGSCTTIGNGNFFSPYVDIEHHCAVADFCTFGPGVMTSSLVKIGCRVKFGTGIFVEPKVAIGADSIVGSGAILTRDIPANSVVKTKLNYAVRPR
jgi:sugar O-acyltransferase (sialic acid O-acetyltransferase NeuD family)